jgi:uncharacterized protein YebE (UPF0316 family)
MISGPGILDWSLLPAAAVAAAIFFLRAIDLTLSTLRMLAVVRGRRSAAWLLGFVEAGLFVTAISGLLSNLRSWPHILAFAAGFATGNVLGMAIESRLAPGHSLLRITSSGRGEAIAQALRGSGHGATEIPGHGMGGTVGLVVSYVPRREVEPTRRLVLAVDPGAFLTVENVRQLRGGWRT